MAQQVNLRDVRVLLREYIRKSSRLGILFSTFEKTGVLTSLAAPGTAPFIVSSTTLVENLNAEFLSGHTADDFVLESELSGILGSEVIDDRVAQLFQPAHGITWSYDDPAGTITPVLANVGIGTGSGTSMLTVAGDILVSTSGVFQGDLLVGGDLIIPTAATSGHFLTSDAEGRASWQPAPENLTLQREEFVSTPAQTLFTLSTFTYTLDGKSLHVYQNGQLLRAGPGEDYLETSDSSITFNVAPDTGSNIVLETLEGGNLSLTDADTVDAFHASAVYQANQLIALNANAKFPTGFTVEGSGIIEGTLFAEAISSLSPLELQTGGTTRIFVDDVTGFVGIGTGTTPPVGMLDVAGPIYLDRQVISPSGVPGKVALFIDDATGQLFTTDESGSPVPAASGVGLTIFDEGIELPQRDDMDFAGAGVTVTDTAGKILVTIPGGGGITFEQDDKIAAGPGDKTFTLSFTPITDSEKVIHNGVSLLRGASNDYTIVGNVITLEAAVIVTAGDVFLALYAR